MLDSSYLVATLEDIMRGIAEVEYFGLGFLILEDKAPLVLEEQLNEIITICYPRGVYECDGCHGRHKTTFGLFGPT